MSPPERVLKVIPGGTGELADGLEDLPPAALAARVRSLRAQNEGLQRDLSLAEENMRELRASRAAYKGLLSRLQKVDPQAEIIESTLAYWRATCHGPRSRVEIPLDGKRAEAVRRTIKRLVEHDEDPALADPDKDVQSAALASATDRAVARIKQAIDGAARYPFEGRYAKRFTEASPNTKRKVDITYILRDELKLEQFVELVEHDQRRIAYAHDLHARLKAQPNLRLMFCSLDPSMGEILCRAIRWCQKQEGPT